MAGTLAFGCAGFASALREHAPAIAGPHRLPHRQRGSARAGETSADERDHRVFMGAIYMCFEQLRTSFEYC